VPRAVAKKCSTDWSGDYGREVIIIIVDLTTIEGAGYFCKMAPSEHLLSKAQRGHGEDPF
jgi:hypothetical protein